MRARNLKPGFFSNEVLCECEPLARILFEGLWCLADREGRLEDRPKRIKLLVLGFDQCDIHDLLHQLVFRDFITRYESDGCKVIQINKFLAHQRPHQSEVDSVLPGKNVISPENSGEKTGNLPSSLNPSSLNPSSSSSSSRPTPNNGSAAAAAADDDDKEEFIDDLKKYGLPGSLAKRYVSATDSALLREILSFVRDNKTLKNPAGAIRSILKDPAAWGFEHAENCWKRPAVWKRKLETMEEKIARLRKEMTPCNGSINGHVSTPKPSG